MNYYSCSGQYLSIERHGMEIILDALQALHEDMKCAEDNSITGITPCHRCGYTVDDVELQLQSLKQVEQ